MKSNAEKYRSTLEDLIMDAVCTSDTSTYSETTRRYIPECPHLHTRRRENQKSHRSRFASTYIALLPKYEHARD
jgi:hypothetical protein